MSTNTETNGHGATDKLRLAVSIALIVGGLAAYYYFSRTSVALRIVGLVATMVAAVGVSYSSSFGRFVREFITESHFELRKIVWPTSQETRQTTLVIFAVVAIVSLILFLYDSIMVWIFGMLFGAGS
ncbi:MAG: preprotein translocase subunit SecE [Rhodanobacteraceae bacterium]|nr:preprotein translocase subunit SecE [Rhodanobacteraceae bacterium]